MCLPKCFAVHENRHSNKTNTAKALNSLNGRESRAFLCADGAIYYYVEVIIAHPPFGVNN